MPYSAFSGHSIEPILIECLWLYSHTSMGYLWMVYCNGWTTSFWDGLGHLEDASSTWGGISRMGEMVTCTHTVSPLIAKRIATRWCPAMSDIMSTKLTDKVSLYDDVMKCAIIIVILKCGSKTCVIDIDVNRIADGFVSYAHLLTISFRMRHMFIFGSSYNNCNPGGPVGLPQDPQGCNYCNYSQKWTYAAFWTILSCGKPTGPPGLQLL